MLNRAKIAISGKSGCGNSTVTRLVAEELGLRVVNYTFHDMAREMGISFEEMVRLANSNPPKYDLELDQKLIAMASESGCVLGSRLAIWLLKDANLKVYLDASPRTRARRIAGREHSSFKKAYDAMIIRDRLDRERYLKIYGIDTDEIGFADLVIDTEPIDQFAVSSRIVSALKEKIL